MGLIDIYSSWLANIISMGAMTKKDDLDSFSIRPSYNKIITRSHVSQVWMVSGIPVGYDKNVTHVIRHFVKENYPHLDCWVHFHSDRVDINTQSKPFMRRMESAMEHYGDYKETLEDVADYQRDTGKVFKNGTRSVRISKDGLVKAEEKMLSYLYVDRSVARGKGTFYTRMFVTVKGQTTQQLGKFAVPFTKFLKGEGLTIYPIYGDMNNYMTNYGPSTLNDGDQKRFYPFLTVDENLTELTPIITRGLFSNGKGPLIGYDILSNLPANADLFNTSTAQVILISGMSGEGKTAYTQMLVPNLMVEDAHVSVVDMKGNEWEKIFPIIGSSYKKLDMDLGLWVNTLDISDLDVDAGDEEEVYSSAISSTVRMFVKVISISEDEGNLKDVVDFLTEASRKVYAMLPGFHEKDRSTFYLTKKLKPSDVIDKLRGIKSESLSASQNSLLDIMIRRALSEFSIEKLTPDKEVLLSDVLNIKYLVYSMNKVKGNSSIGQDSMRLTMISHLNKKKHYYRKKQKLHTVEVYEETQLSNSITDDGTSLVDLISESTTIGRSENVMVIILTNSIGIFEQPEFRSIISNITGLVVGKIIEKDIEVLSTLNGGESLVPYVRNISQDTKGILKNCFAVRLNSGGIYDQTIVKAIIPEDIELLIRQRDRNEDS